MDYQTGKRYRNRSLLGLIGQRKFEEGESLGKSIRTSISDKMRSSALGIKEQLDPLNLARQLGGKGIFGDFLTGAIGKISGRSASDIEYFGGFGGKKRRIRDPLRASIGASNIQPLKSNEGLADVLGKIYNFMVKTKEEKIKQDEIGKSFRQEQLDEDQKRHDELVKAIQEGTPTATKEKAPKSKNMFDSLMEQIQKILEPILEIFSSIKDFIKGPIWQVLKSGWVAIAEFLAPLLLPALAVAGIAALIWAEFAAAGYLTKWWKENEVKSAQELGGNVAAAAAKEQIAMPNYDPTDAEAGDKWATLEAKKGVAIDKKNKLVAEYMQTKGFKEKKGISWNPFKDPNDKTYLDSKGNEAPPELKKEARQWADSKLVEQEKPKDTATPAPISPTPQNDPKTTYNPTTSTTPTKSTPQLTPKSIPKSTPNISPEPEPPVSSSEPNIQVNNTTNTISGKKPQTVATSSAKQRNSDLEYYHDRISPAY